MKEERGVLFKGKNTELGLREGVKLSGSTERGERKGEK